MVYTIKYNINKRNKNKRSKWVDCFLVLEPTNVCIWINGFVGKLVVYIYTYIRHTYRRSQSCHTSKKWQQRRQHFIIYAPSYKLYNFKTQQKIYF